MIVIYKEKKIQILWSIFKGQTDVLENFSRSRMGVFLIGKDNRWRLNYVIGEDGVITVNIDEGLDAGVYSLKAVWEKNHEVKAPQYSGTRSVNMALVSNVFAITEYAKEDAYPDVSTAKLKVKSSVLTYGYDGMDAYELAVLRGKTELDEAEWIDLVACFMDEMRELVEEVKGKQDKLVSGENIVTINGESLLHSGNIVIKGGGGGEGIQSLITLTLTEYNNLATKDANTLYLIKADNQSIKE